MFLPWQRLFRVSIYLASFAGLAAALLTRTADAPLPPTLDLIREWACSVTALAWLPLLGAILGTFFISRSSWLRWLALLAATIALGTYEFHRGVISASGEKPATTAMDCDSRHQLKIVVLNAFHENLNAAAFNQVVAEVNPDIVALVEVAPEFFASLDTPQLPFRYQKLGSYGVGIALVTRHAFEIREPQLLAATDTRRHLVAAFPSDSTIGVPPFQFLLMHPDPPTTPHRLALRNSLLATATTIGEVEEPHIIAGDFNLTPFSPYFQKMIAAGFADAAAGFDLGATWRLKEFPLLRFAIDHLIYRGNVRVVSVRRLGDIGSDHYPLLYELGFCPLDMKNKQG